MAEGNKIRELKKTILRLKKRLRFYEECDTLTGLYNRNAFQKKVRNRLNAYADSSFDIICIDIERFKLINDLYGPDVGDNLLCYLSQELQKAFLPAGGILARISNDIFALCLSGGQRHTVEATVLRIFKNCPLDTPVVPAIGFCPVADRAQQVNLMCDWAILALNSIKGDYLRHSAVFNSSQRNLLLEEQELLHSAEAALSDHEFEIFMQPKCNMRTGKVVGAEALVRWRHPEKGILSPGAFIPAFERNGFVKKLDIYIWEETVSWLKRWTDAGNEPLPVSVNISRIDIYGMDVCEIMERLLEKYQIDVRYLELEITEGAYIDQPEEVINTIERLMRHGFTVLMDDFGSGYSSLNMLNKISVDVLKIDMGFLAQNDRKSKSILESVVHMGKWLDLPVIAEGVETQEQVDFLLGIGCIYAQGYFFYRPMPLESYEQLLLDGEKVDYAGRGMLQPNQEMLLDFHDLFHKDAMSARLLEHILGAIALYRFDGRRLILLRGTGEYYRLTGQADLINVEGELDMIAATKETDRPILLQGLRLAKESPDESGAEIYIRQMLPESSRWLMIRLFHLAEKAEGDIYYGMFTDVTEQMETIERLRVSEEQFCLAMEATNIVIFELDVNTRVAYYSEYAQKVFNLNATVINAPEGFIEQGTVCEESQADFRAIYDAIYRGEERASCIIHARLGDGTLIWNRITLTAIKGPYGETTKAVGLVETVSHDLNAPTESLAPPDYRPTADEARC